MVHNRRIRRGALAGSRPDSIRIIKQGDMMLLYGLLYMIKACVNMAFLVGLLWVIVVIITSAARACWGPR